MKQARRMLIDVSSVLWQSLLAAKDEEYGFKVEHEGKQVHVNGWQFGLECAISHITSVMRELELVPHQLVFVVEGKMSKARRKAIYSAYKDGRDSRPDAAYEQFQLCREELIKTFRNVGAQVVTQDGVEADDVIAYLARHLDGEKIILSNDGDLSVLISDKVLQYRKGKILTENPYGPFPSKFTTVYKALVGDPSDNIKGAPGFGEKAFLDLLVWGGDAALPAIEDIILKKELHTLQDDIATFKPMKKIVEGADSVYASYAVARLYPEWCDTMRQPLQWKAGMVRGRDVVTDERLRPYAQSVRLVTRANYAEAAKFFEEQLAVSPVIGLDIETATSEESDEWLATREKEDKVDVFGSELTGMSLTFGRNGQYTFYFSVNHKDTDNITSEMLRDVVALIPADGIPVAIQNFAFEGPILYGCWGDVLKHNGWHGFIPNVIDTAILSSYVDENLPQGLKQNSKHYLDYDQETYDQVTSKTGKVGTLTGGKVIKSWSTPIMVKGVQQILNPETEQWEEVEIEVQAEEDGEKLYDHWETRRYKMNELTGQEVLSYGCDDTICTVALFHHFQLRMEIEKTWNVMREVEQLPAYVIALAYHQGTKFSLERMKEIEREDEETYQREWATVRQFLIEQGWEGTVCPTYAGDLTPAQVKEIVQIILGQKLETQVRTVSKLAKLVEVMEHDDAPLLAQYIAEGNLAQINDWVASRFSGEPVFELGSPKQMRHFLYETLGLPVRIVNSTTPTERKEKPDLARAVSRYKKIWAGSQSEPPLTDAEKELLKLKAKTDDTAIDFALALDVPDHPVLKALQTMKKCLTRKTLFYNNYTHLQHWKDGKIHGQAGQTRTVTRRFAPSEPNLAQLPKKGEGVKFRECFVPHHKDAVMASIDFSGQELRQGAAQSGDPNMMACFVGDNLKDMHSMTAAGAMEKKWGKTVLAELIGRFGQEGDDEYSLFLRLRKCKEDEAVAKQADDLRKNAKNVNFGAQYDAQAPKLAETLIIPVADAEAFLQAKYAMFPRFEEWKEEVKEFVQTHGYVLTPLGARRHLRDSLLSDEWGVADKALRQGPNFKIQGGSAEQTKLAMARLWKSDILFKYDMVFFAPIHDELVFSVHRDHACEVIKIVNWCMTQPYADLPVPFLGSISLGPNFGTQYECGDWYIEENIKEALGKVFPEMAVA